MAEPPPPTSASTSSELTPIPPSDGTSSLSPYQDSGEHDNSDLDADHNDEPDEEPDGEQYETTYGESDEDFAAELDEDFDEELDESDADLDEESDGNPDEALDEEQDEEHETSASAPYRNPALEALSGQTKTTRRKRHPPVSGGRVATCKPITPDYDSEDEIIVEMKQQGYADSAVVKRLVDEGRTAYDPKSINSRWQRIRKVLQQAEDQLLDEELTDWHEGEDELLVDAYEKASNKIKEELEKVLQKRFKYVAREINKSAARPRFSARACKERYEALKAGTARCPPERDPDPAGRARERDERIAAFKARKQEERERVRVEAEANKQEKARRARQRDVNRQRRQARRIIRAARKKEEESFQNSKQQAILEKRQTRRQALIAVRDARSYALRKSRCEKALRRRLEKDNNFRERKLARYSLQFPVPAPVGFQASSNDASANRGFHIDEDFASDLAIANANSMNMSAPARGPIPAAVQAGVDFAVHKGPVSANSQQIFGEEPRNWLTMAELYDLLRDRGMLLNRMKECKQVVVSRLAKNDNELSEDVLREMLVGRGAATIGDKAALIRRLQESDARNSTVYKRKHATKAPPSARLNERGAVAKKPRGPVTSSFKSTMLPKPPNAKRYCARNVVGPGQKPAIKNESPTNTPPRPDTRRTPKANSHGPARVVPNMGVPASVQSGLGSPGATPTLATQTDTTGLSSLFSDDVPMLDADSL